MIVLLFKFQPDNPFGGPNIFYFGKGLPKMPILWFPSSIRPTRVAPTSTTIAMLHGWIILGRHGHTFWSFHGHGFWCFLLGWALGCFACCFSRRAARADKFHKTSRMTSKGIHFNKGKYFFFRFIIMKVPLSPTTKITCLLIKTGKLSFPVFTLKQVELPGAK